MGLDAQRGHVFHEALALVLFEGLQRAGYHPEDTEFPLVARTYGSEFLPLDYLKENWFISFGDFDIV